MLALGVRCIALAAEPDPVLREAKRKIFPNLVEVSAVRDIDEDLFHQVFARRRFSAILIGSSSSCHDDSFLNLGRQGHADSHGHRLQQLQRIVGLLKRSARGVPIFQMFETAATLPAGLMKQCCSLVGSVPIQLDAACWGWTHRCRLYWLRGPSGGYHPQKEYPLPAGFEIKLRDEQHHYHHLVSNGNKVWPNLGRFTGGYEHAFDPLAVLSGVDVGFFTFTQECCHPTDQASNVSAEARTRFFHDDKRFPPLAYEVHSLLWKGDSWRTPTPAERAHLHGMPSTMLDAIPSSSDPRERTAVLNSAVGNGFHVPPSCLS